MRDLLEGNPNADHSAVANSIHDPADEKDLLRSTSRPPPSINSISASDESSDEGTARNSASQDRTYIDAPDNDSAEDIKPDKKRKGKGREETPGPLAKRIKTGGPAEMRSPQQSRKKGGVGDDIAAAIEKSRETQLEVEKRRNESREERERMRYEIGREIKEMELKDKREARDKEMEERREIRLAEAAERDKQREHELMLAKIQAGIPLK